MSLQQQGYTHSQAASQTAQVRKQKTARRKAAKSKAADLKRKPSTGSGALSASYSPAGGDFQKMLQEHLAAAKIRAGASTKPVTQPPKAEQVPHWLSSHGHTAPQPAPENTSQSLQQSRSGILESAGGSRSSAAPDAIPCGPCLPAAPSGQPASARSAPVRLSKATLQHGKGSRAHSRPPPLDALLPSSAAQPHHIQVWIIRGTAHVCPDIAITLVYLPFPSWCSAEGLDMCQTLLQQHGKSSPALSKPKQLDALLPTCAPQPHDSLVGPVLDLLMCVLISPLHLCSFPVPVGAVHKTFQVCDLGQGVLPRCCRH